MQPFRVAHALKAGEQVYKSNFYFLEKHLNKAAFPLVMKKGVVLAILFLLAVPAVFALGTAGPVGQCRTRTDCYQLLKTAQPVCEPGFVKSYSPDCNAGRCEFCRQVSGRIVLDCRVDSDCAQKNRCNAGLFSRCLGRKCICTSQVKPECSTTNDCTRKFLGRLPQRLVCERNKCVAPKPVITMLPWRAKPINYTSALPRLV